MYSAEVEDERGQNISALEGDNIEYVQFLDLNTLAYLRWCRYGASF